MGGQTVQIRTNIFKDRKNGMRLRLARMNEKLKIKYMEIHMQVFATYTFYFSCFVLSHSKYGKNISGQKEKKKSFCSLISLTDHQNKRGNSNSCHTMLDIHPLHQKKRGLEHTNLHLKARGTEPLPARPGTSRHI